MSYLSLTDADRAAMLEAGIGLGYVPAAMAAPGTGLVVDVRGRARVAEVATKPIYKREE